MKEEQEEQEEQEILENFVENNLIKDNLNHFEYFRNIYYKTKYKYD